MGGESRDAGIDVVRTAGIVAIVAGHVWSTELVEIGLYSWHVPVFFFLAGYLATSKRTLPQEIRARSLALLRPYIFWFATIFTIFAVVTLTTPGPTLKSFALPVYGGFYATQPFTTFWFVFALFAAAIAWRALLSAPKGLRLAVTLLALIASALAGPLLARSPLAIGTALPALTFLAAGHWARTFESHISRRRLPIAGGAAILTAVAAIGLGIAEPLDIKQGDWGTPVISVLSAAAISWGLTVAARTIPWGLAGRWFTRFALVGFTVVLVHPLILWGLQPFSDLPLVLVFATALIFPAMLGLALVQTPLAGWATGARPRGRAIDPRQQISWSHNP